MKKNQLLLVMICLVMMASCSMHFEKRRYRPGYHVEIVKHQQRNKIVSNNNHFTLVEIEPSTSVQIPVTLFPQNLKTNQKINLDRKSSVKNNVEKDIKPQIGVSTTNTKSEKLKSEGRIKTLLGVKKTQGLIGRKIAAWVIGVIGIIIAVVAIALAATGGWGLGGYIIGIGFGAAGFFGLIALLARFVGLKREKENTEKYPNGDAPLKQSFKNGNFIYSIITMAIAILGFIFSFFIRPFGYIALALGLICTICAIIALAIGLKTTSTDKSTKTKLTNIFALTALLIAITAIVIAFL